MEAESDLDITTILDEFPQAIIETISPIPLSCYPKIPSETIAIWSTSTSTHPLLFASNSAWAIDPPFHKALILASLESNTPLSCMTFAKMLHAAANAVDDKRKPQDASLFPQLLASI